MKTNSMTIGGAPMEGNHDFDVINPATGELVGLAPECTPEQLDFAMDAASGAFRPWSRDRPLRARCMYAAADALESRASEIAPIITAEQGKPLADAQREVLGGCAWLRYFANVELPPELLDDRPDGTVRLFRKPLGVVAGIVPWNFPVVMALQAIAPAVAAGNTIVVKPSPFTPLATLAVGQILATHFPAGVINVVSGGDELGSRIAAHPTVRKVHFTGSVSSGKQVALSAAADLKRVTLELGGNDPAIVLDDVDVDLIADRLFWSAFANAGQVCIAVKRVYVAEARYDELVAAMTARAKSVRVGDGMAPDTQMGPVTNRAQFDRVASLIDDAKTHGARVMAGGAPLDGPGLFFEPTVLCDVDDATRVVEEEQFGPVLPMMAFGDVQDAIDRANRTHFGLGASVWTSDPAQAQDVVDRLESGMVWVNNHMVVRPDVPVGGTKWSGLGVSWGAEGLRSFTDPQVVHMPRLIDS